MFDPPPPWCMTSFMDGLLGPTAARVFFQVSTMSLSCLLTGRRKAILLFGNRISCIIIYVMNNLVNPLGWWQCSIKITVLFVGRCLPGKFHQVDSAGSLRRVTFMSCAQNVKTYVLACELIFVVLMLKDVCWRLH